MKDVEIENAIVAHLATRLEGVVVESSPSDPDSWDGKAGQGVAFVRYNFGAPDVRPGGIVPPQIMRTVQYTIFCGARSLRERGGHKGAYEILAGARDAMWGFTVPGSRTVFFPSKDGYFKEMNGIWWYALVVEAQDLYKPQQS